MKAASAPGVGAREIAARVLERVDQDAAFAAAALDAELERHPQLDSRDRGLATELVYGTLRTRGVLRERLERHVPRGLAKTDARVVAQLELAAYQLLLLDRVPAFAAVNAAVETVSRAQGRRVGGFVNAVLRKLADQPTRLSLGDAAVRSLPTWLRQRLEAAVGPDEMQALLVGPSGDDAFRVSVRTRGGPLPEWLAEASVGRASPLSRLVTGGGDLRRRPGFAEGVFVIQEEGAQVVGLALGAQAGDRVLDACAGRGQKTTLLLERVGETGEVWAADLHPAKLEALAEETRRLDLPDAESQAVDWTVGAGRIPEAHFDRVLVDAPCTGVGTLRRRPEIAARLGPEDPARLAQLAEAILRRAATRAKVGGRVVFAVCSVLSEECEELVARVADVLEPVSFDAPELGALIPPEATALRLLPGQHGTEGYFVASFLRR